MRIGLARCLGDTPRDRRNARRMLGLSVVWALCFVGAGQLLGRGLVPPGGLAWAVAAVPAVLGAALWWAWFDLVRQFDELQRRIQLDALGISFGVTFFGILAWQGFQRAGAPTLSLDDGALLMVALYVGLLFYGQLSYK